jgi:hypothetical protein
MISPAPPSLARVVVGWLALAWVVGSIAAVVLDAVADVLH